MTLHWSWLVNKLRCPWQGRQWGHSNISHTNRYTETSNFQISMPPFLSVVPDYPWKLISLIGLTIANKQSAHWASLSTEHRQGLGKWIIEKNPFWQLKVTKKTAIDFNPSFNTKIISGRYTWMHSLKTSWFTAVNSIYLLPRAEWSRLYLEISSRQEGAILCLPYFSIGIHRH